MGFPIPAEKIEYRHYIDGKFTESSDNGKFELKSPYSHDKITDICEASEDDTNRAVAAAKAAFPAWAAKSPAERGALMKALAEKIRAAHNHLAQLNAMDMGRPVSTYFDGYFAASLFEHNAEAGYTAQGKTSLNSPGYVNMTFRQPIGPVAAIIPWNIPTMSFAMKVAPALAAGCTIVLKTSEKAPLTPTHCAQLAHEVGFPPGVINVLNGHGTPSGAILASHMDIRMVNFTGSTMTGKKIQQMAAASNLKKVILELGGKSPALVFEDADIVKAATETSASMQMLMGQACIANSRIYVQESVADKFKEAFLALFQAAKKGDPLLPETQQGPQADQLQYERIQTFLQAASEGKGKLEAGGKATQVDGKGYFIEPTVYSGVDENEKTQKEEVFGPFVNINTFKTEAEVLEKANATEYGLYASVFTKDISRALRVAKAFESGTVGINCTSPSMAMDMPFGGYKGSGQGREGYGYSLEEHLEHKTVLIKIDEEAASPLQTDAPKG
ncbi:Putative aldehyde dehydrogenase domain, aldehyde/histidinol dehydrogenase [Septoria linicola]|uniref:aldehyde dehydrogenase (NAD(+)) n=1 Tax=Septoria linicola TaxID=215465 RepID=A0A9Q9ANM8_9PEZI|nr:putative aldehyde dehydrogenase domain, aldehyde/histidinol dehydrogenase [Septoria linicola]USW51519.1 Putative aldehyde dehydrogenase domain, aldehyde/histidinol dehydrogenase [Septoria linicola]